ncbi:hypothetical protein D3C72_1445110 [compost metagenome]
MQSRPEPRDPAVRIRPAHARAIRLRDVVLTVADVDQLALRLDDPIVAQWHGVTALRRYGEALRVVADHRQQVALHAIGEPAVLEPGVHVGAELVFVILVPGAVGAHAPPFYPPLGSEGVALRLRVRPGVAVAAHQAEVRARGFAEDLPLGQFGAALEQEGVRAGLEHAIAAVAALPLAYRAQPA